MRRVLPWCAIGGLLLVLACQPHLPAREGTAGGAAAASALISPTERLVAPATPGRASTVGLMVLVSTLLAVLLGVRRRSWRRVTTLDPPPATHPRLVRWRALLLGAPPLAS